MKTPKIGHTYKFIRKRGAGFEHTDFTSYEDGVAGFVADGHAAIFERQPDNCQAALSELERLGFVELNEARESGFVPVDWQPTPETSTCLLNMYDESLKRITEREGLTLALPPQSSRELHFKSQLREMSLQDDSLRRLVMLSLWEYWRPSSGAPHGLRVAHLKLEVGADFWLGPKVMLIYIVQSKPRSGYGINKIIFEGKLSEFAKCFEEKLQLAAVEVKMISKEAVLQHDKEESLRLNKQREEILRKAKSGEQ